MINYPEDFKSECKKVYPMWFGLHEALDAGSEFVGEYLREASKDNLDIKEIKKKRDLFDRWLKLRMGMA